MLWLCALRTLTASYLRTLLHSRWVSVNQWKNQTKCGRHFVMVNFLFSPARDWFLHDRVITCKGYIILRYLIVVAYMVEFRNNDMGVVSSKSRPKYRFRIFQKRYPRQEQNDQHSKYKRKTLATNLLVDIKFSARDFIKLTRVFRTYRYW